MYINILTQYKYSWNLIQKEKNIYVCIENKARIELITAYLFAYRHIVRIYNGVKN